MRSGWAMVAGGLALAISASQAEGQAADGAWRGDLATPAGALTLVLTIHGGEGTIGVPARGASGIPVTDVVITEAGDVSFSVPADAAAFEGRLEQDRLVGEWLQAGQRVAIEFERLQDAEVASAPTERRQTPRPPFLYDVREVNVATDVSLGCTLTTPRVARGEVPGVVLLTVAGANDRDQTHSGHKPYMVLADGLTRRGVAVLRCDDRGVGTSGGDLTAVAMSDLVGDALAMVRHLGRSEDVGPVGIIGNSEGSVVGAMAAAASPADVAFVVLLGGVGVRGADVIRTRLVAQAEAAGSSPADAEAAMAPFDELVEVVSSSGGIGAARLRAEQPNVYARLEAVAARAGERDPFLPRDLEQRVALFAGPWYHAQITLDGGMVLEDVEVPVLALTGTKDRTNLPEQNLPAIRAALERGGNPDFQVSEIADLNHVFQTAVEGGLAEYGRLEESFSPVAMELIGTWILERFGLAASGVGDGQPRSSMGR